MDNKTNITHDSTNPEFLKKSLKKISLGGKHEEIISAIKELEHYEKGSKHYEEKLNSLATKRVIAYFNKVITGTIKDPIGSEVFVYNVKAIIENTLEEEDHWSYTSKGSETISRILNSKNIQDFISKNILKDIKNIFICKSIGIKIPAKITNSSKVKEMAEEYIKKIKLDNKYYMQIAYHESTYLMENLNLSKEINFHVISYLINHNFFEDSVALHFIEKMPTNYIHKDIAIRIFRNSLRNNDEKNNTMVINLFKLKKNDIFQYDEGYQNMLDICEDCLYDLGIESKDRERSLEGVKLLYKSGLKISYNDFSENFKKKLFGWVRQAISENKFGLAKKIVNTFEIT
ncbi:MAG TPA: hypothetical protein PK048_02390 [Candidatus Absconditabacterales bacterium]|nr:hypothetical protein [Candidatus Absconditabacterales bacterium]